MTLEQRSSNDAASAIVALLRERISQEADGWLSFRDYMDLCLYEPSYGYYTSDRVKLGREGDFYTSSSLGGLLGESIAEWISGAAAAVSDLTEARRPFTLVEWGGGDGRLARQLLDRLQQLDPELYARTSWISIERSEYHRRLQAEQLAPHEERTSWMTEEAWQAAAPWRHTIVYSNELPDAFPVHRLVYREHGWMELGVGWDVAECRLIELERAVSSPELLAYIESEQLPTRPGQQFEAPLDALRWYERTVSALGSGSGIVTIDYGDVREELHAEHRMRGTLLAYRRHQASDTPLARPGEQDVTAHVNFSALRETGEAQGLATECYETQKQFLVRHGLLNKLQSHAATDPFSPEARRNRAIRQLLLSDQMSELFKVLIQRKR
ncbi:class I SAM-dependent methyltransferase [Paenibacillus sp. YYML68]|uniref:class I SAM-dependent methyltransferase n=1 Tax=Paenibacillus sp. YYML68 TaxID=2909250 RepID=UPI002491708A|nr:SAM-dependent methyltransferase [Paenibacillus sp. YYML68]